MKTSPARELEAWLQTLHLYGAAAIVAYGWGMCSLLGWRSGPWLPLWFCAALLIYNLDRIRLDPADALNTPGRAATSRRLRPVAIAVALGAGVGVILLPLLARDWITLALVIGGGIFCANYSAPLLGFRWKDVPLVKTFFAPTIVCASIFALPLLHGASLAEPLTVGLAVARAWLFLMFNMILCDLRDIDGDRALGIRSLPVVLGRRRTRALLFAIWLALAALGLALARTAQRPHAWLTLTVTAALYLALLLVLTRQPRGERFYEWCVEGMLFLPALSALR